MTHWYRAAFFLTLTRRSRGDSRTTCSWTYETETTSRCCSATWHSCLRALAQAQYPMVVGTSGARAPLQRRKEPNITELRISYYPALHLSDLCHTCLTHAMPGPRITRDNPYGAPLAPGYSSKSTAWLVRDWSIFSRMSVRTISGKLSAWSSASSGSTGVAVLGGLQEYKF